MNKFSRTFILVILLVFSLGMGEYYWTRLATPGCQDWQNEVQRRIESYARMYVPDHTPQVQVQSVCGSPYLADAIFFRAQQWAWLMGLRSSKPLQEADLRMTVTKDLLQHPDMGSLSITVRFDPQLAAETRQKLEELISRYLMVDEQRHRLEYRRLKKPLEAFPLLKNPDLGQGIGIKPSTEASSVAKAAPLPLMANPEPRIQSSLFRALNLLSIFVLGCLGTIFLVQGLRNMWRKSRKQSSNQTQDPVGNTADLSILFAPRVGRDLGERSRELWRLLLQLDRSRAQKWVKNFWEKDREALLHFLTKLEEETQESILSALPLDDVLKMGDLFQQNSVSHRDGQRAAFRVLLDLAREIGSLSRMADAPLFIHLMTRREWQKVSQHMTRPRRRVLAELLDSERAAWLRTRQDLHPDCFQSGSKDAVVPELLYRRVRSILQVEADQLREQLYSDRQVMQVVDGYFADLTLDTGLNSDLAMLVLGQCQQAHAGFGRLVERRDVHLQAALDICDDQQLALLLYDLDPQLKATLSGQIGKRLQAVDLALYGLEQDKNHSKSLRMQARSLQRFLERQVLVADLLCHSNE